MDIRPILSTLRRHKTAATLIVMEIALSCAILCNAMHLIAGRLDRIHLPSGLAEAELVRIEVAGQSRQANPDAQTRQDLEALRNVPGVKAVTVANQLPFGMSGWTSTLGVTPGDDLAKVNAALYNGSENFVSTLGLHLLAGRDFQPDEYRNASEVFEGQGEPTAAVAILNRKLAQHLFGKASAVGQAIYIWSKPTQVIGVVEELAALSANDEGYAFVLPMRTAYSDHGHYLMRVDPDRREEVLAAAVKALHLPRDKRILLAHESYEALRDNSFQQDFAMAWLLGAVCLGLLVVTAVGIVGLASFWVQQRTRMIGVRRALGASRAQIVRYFQTENFLLSSFGIVIGMVGAYVINHGLMLFYEIPRLPWHYLPWGALTLWLLGQLAVLGPALRAAALPPVVVMRGA